MKIYLLRHGEVQGGEEKTFLGRTDRPLSTTGRSQAETWHRYFSGRLPGRIVTSPLTRTNDFARIVAGDQTVAICKALAEIDLGDWDGRPFAEIRRCEPASWLARGQDIAGFQTPGGESFADLSRRVVPAFERLAAAGSDLLIVGHAGVNRVLLCHLLGMPLAHLFRIGQDYACLNVVEGGHAGWRVAGMNIAVPGGTGF